MAQGTRARSARKRLALLALGIAALLACFASSALASPPELIAGPESGFEAGQVAHPASLAVHQSDGALWVADQANYRVDKFSSAGGFLSAVGYGVADGTTEALQTCTTTCFRGLASSGPGGLYIPSSVAVDNTAGASGGDLWVSEFNYRISKFSPSGQFLLMIGKGVDQGPHHPGNVCTAAFIVEGDICGAGTTGTNPGEISSQSPTLAVDAVGDLWVADIGRLQRFGPEGEFIEQFAVPAIPNEQSALAIDTDPSSPAFEDFYVLKPPTGGQNEVQRISPPTNPETSELEGTFTLSFGGKTTAPIPASAKGRDVQAALEDLPAIGTGNVRGQGNRGFPDVYFGGKLAALDVEELTASKGASVTTIYQGVAPTPGAILKLSPTGTLIEELDSSGFPRALGLDPATGTLYVSDQRTQQVPRSAPTLLSFAPSGAQTTRFAAGQTLDLKGNALAFGDTAHRLYAASFIEDEGTLSAVQAFAPPAPGPYLSEGSLDAVARPASASLKATLTPEGSATEYHFEYETQQQFDETSGSLPFAHSSTTKTLPADFAEHEVSELVTGLTSETNYRFRLFAENADGKGNVASQEATFETLSPVLIDSESVSRVSSVGATLEAEINTLETADEYHFEYLDQATYEENIANGVDPFTGALSSPSPDGQLAPIEGDQSVSQAISGLQPSTAYRYRVFAHNPGGFKAGTAHTFTTQGQGDSLLPDHRAYELVSPPDKLGAFIQTPPGGYLVQASASGDAFAWTANAPTESSPAGFSRTVTVLSRRAAEPGRLWTSEDISTPHVSQTGIKDSGREYTAFSRDLSRALVNPQGLFTPLSPDATAPTPYVRSDFAPGDVSQPCLSSCYQPLVTAANVPPGTVIGHERVQFGDPEILGASADGSRIVLTASGAALTDGAISTGGPNLYQFVAGQLSLVNIDPSGNPISPSAAPVLGDRSTENAEDAISDDGTRVIFSEESGKHHLYLRDTVREETVLLDQAQGGSGSGAAQPRFQGASGDGNRIFFSDTQRLVSTASGSGKDLYECAIVEVEGALKCQLSDLTPQGNGGAASVLGLLPGISKDGGTVYFVANGKLTSQPNTRDEEAVSGNCEPTGEKSNTGESETEIALRRCNLYVRTAGVTRLVAVLSGGDERVWGVNQAANAIWKSANVSPSGRYLAFTSRLPLTGFDNRDAATGEPDQEVFLFDAAADDGEGRLICPSCNPTSSRPLGIRVGSHDTEGAPAENSQVWYRTRIAANVPTAQFARITLRQPRYLLDSGRLFFNSYGPLLPQDSNGTWDVYSYEPISVPESSSSNTCATSSAGYVAQYGGCLSLISDGKSKEESSFMDASESGDDAFFLTSARLSARDKDTAADIYDARVEGGEEQVPAPVVCVGDACQQPPSPPNDPTPGSLTFLGAGNPIECPKGKTQKVGKCINNKQKKKHRTKAHRNRKAGKNPAKNNRGGHK
jgi:hypothetical protein